MCLGEDKNIKNKNKRYRGKWNDSTDESEEILGKYYDFLRVEAPSKYGRKSRCYEGKDSQNILHKILNLKEKNI